MLTVLCAVAILSPVAAEGKSLTALSPVEVKNYRKLNSKFAMGDRLFDFGFELDQTYPNVNITDEEDCKVVYDLKRKHKYLVGYAGVRDVKTLSENAFYNRLVVKLDGVVALDKPLYGPTVTRFVIDVTGVESLAVRTVHGACLAEPRLVNILPAPQPGDWTYLPATN